MLQTNVADNYYLKREAPADLTDVPDIIINVQMHGEINIEHISDRMHYFTNMEHGSRPPVKGKLIDVHTRCAHYHSPVDIIAIKFRCCNEYYACFHCHEECADHSAERWKKEERATKAVLCGNCNYEMSITEYLNCGYLCPDCRSEFNPKCKGHEHYYFEE